MVQDLSLILASKMLSERSYILEVRINEGAYGEVYEVVHIKTQEKKAIKLIDLTPINKLNKAHQVSTEISCLQKLNHPGIIKLFEVLRWPQHIGIVMELGRYGDLFQLINLVHSKKELKARLTKIMTFYLGQALQVIDYLHSGGIVHRDIKPQNFVLGGELKLKLIDFGTVQVSNTSPLFSVQDFMSFSPPQLQLQHSLVGSANYLSPQSLQMNYSAKSDIWAFGVLAYKFYFNSLPFQGNNNLQIFQQLSQGDIDLGEADHAIQELIVLCLKRDPAERATAKMLKLCSLFKGINFKTIFQVEPPIKKGDLQTKIEQQRQYLFELTLQKRMFFGNFKPRILTISTKKKKLMMAYRYVPTKLIKSQFELDLNDYAQVTKVGQFLVSTKDKKYNFRVYEGQNVDQIVHHINSVIKKYYLLQ